LVQIDEGSLINKTSTGHLQNFRLPVVLWVKLVALFPNSEMSLAIIKAIVRDITFHHFVLSLVVMATTVRVLIFQKFEQCSDVIETIARDMTFKHFALSLVVMATKMCLTAFQHPEQFLAAV
jgi:hypothetical protein